MAKVQYKTEQGKRIIRQGLGYLWEMLIDENGVRYWRMLPGQLGGHRKAIKISDIDNSW